LSQSGHRLQNVGTVKLSVQNVVLFLICRTNLVQLSVLNSQNTKLI